MNRIDDRSSHIFQLIVEEFLQNGIPVGSRTISKSLQQDLSPATIRNVMADLEDAGFLASPHTSAGRQPTQKGLRFYVDTLMKIDDVTHHQQEIEKNLRDPAQSLPEIYRGVSAMLSGMSSCVGIVIAPKMNKPIRKIEFLKLEPRKVLAILITSDGMIENRVVQLSDDVTRSELEQVSNFLNNRLEGKTLGEVETLLASEIGLHKSTISQLSAVLMKEGIIHPLSSISDGHIFVNGQARLFDDPAAQSRLDEIRELLAILEEKQTILDMMGQIRDGDGVQVFIGSENPMFGQPNWSTIVRAYHDQNGRIVGATGVIGPTRLHYGKIVPIVDYTSLFLERLFGNRPFVDGE